MIEFLLAHWSELIYIILTLCCLIVGICKKTKVISEDTIFEQLLVILPGMIVAAEQPGLKGHDKKDIVIDVALTWLSKMTGKDKVEMASVYSRRIDDAIEQILSTPKKKEIINEKDNG